MTRPLFLHESFIELQSLINQGKNEYLNQPRYFCKNIFLKLWESTEKIGMMENIACDMPQKNFRH